VRKKIENVDPNFWGEGGVKINLTNGFQDPENLYRDSFVKKKIDK